MGDRWIEENEAVRMSYCGEGMGGWVGGWEEISWFHQLITGMRV